VVLAALGALAFAVPEAQAHAELTSSTPAESAVLASPPTTLRLTFTEDLMPGFAQLTLTVARAAPKSLPVKIDGRTLTVSVPTAAAPGRWVAAYRVVSVDGHAITGTIPFTVRTATTATSTATSAAGPASSLRTTRRAPDPLPSAQAAGEAPLAGQVVEPAALSSAAKGSGTAPSDLAWWVASAMFLVSAAVVARLGQKGS
jgi:methionine-rich copper-binding protein CopC